ncbi:MAG TPA: hypothetical protein VEQ63_04165 [Bryobacteraceae bacterium]|nr:hypothetical protein [Bryobacteraceae bacterium]
MDCPVSHLFAWSFWTEVHNWTLDADIEAVELSGPFAPGALGVTQSKTSGRVEWRVAEAQPGRAVLEFYAPGAVARFLWTFEDAGGHTRVTQRASLAGERATEYVAMLAPGLEAGIPAGMRKLCQAMEAAAGSDQ